MAGYVGKITAAGVQNAVAQSLYGTCSTEAGTAAKTVVCEDFSAMMHGVSVKVYFGNHNAASNPTLNVNGKGAKPILLYGNGSTAPGQTAATSWNDGAVITLTYDANALNNTGAWFVNDWLNTDTNTTYGPATTDTAGLMSAADKTKLNGLSAAIRVSNKEVTGGWSVSADEDTGYYSCDVAISGVSTDHFPIVSFDEADNESYQFASYAESGADKITIYAKVKPTGTITIPGILCVK